MIALRGYDASFVEDCYFRSFVQSLDPEFEVPSHVAIEEMCDGIFDEEGRNSSIGLGECCANTLDCVSKRSTLAKLWAGRSDRCRRPV